MAEIIFGIDHGNGNMKGSNVDFPCGLVRYTSEPGRFMNEDILEYQGTFYTLSETRMPFKADKTVDEDYFILTLFALALEAKSRGITLSGKDIVLGIGLPPADFGQQAPGFKRYFMEHSKHGISFKFNGKSVNCYLKDTFVSPQNFAAVMCYKASLFKQYRTVNCIDIGDGTVDLLVIRKGQPDLSVRVSDRSGMAILRSEISNVIQQNFGIHLESSDVEQVLMQEATILDEEVIREIQKMAEDWMQRITNKLHAYEIVLWVDQSYERLCKLSEQKSLPDNFIYGDTIEIHNGLETYQLNIGEFSGMATAGDQEDIDLSIEDHEGNIIAKGRVSLTVGYIEFDEEGNAGNGLADSIEYYHSDIVNGLETIAESIQKDIANEWSIAKKFEVMIAEE